MKDCDVAIIGAGFAGLSAALDLARAGLKPIVFEADDQVGGLAGSFEVGGERLEKFYHHWFNNDLDVIGLIRELGEEERVLYRETRTGSYHANTIFRLSRPLDLLRYTPLSFVGRIRLGLLALRARTVRDWSALEERTAFDWLREVSGEEVLEKVWKPLLIGKFGQYAEEVSAVWIWNKLRLRGGSRGKGGAEVLAYYRGGFAALAERIAEEIRTLGGEIRLGEPVRALDVEDGRIRGLRTDRGTIRAERVLHTPALPILRDLVAPHVERSYLMHLDEIGYLANICLVLELDRSLSDTYWLNIMDPSFPFVGLIEHTNFEPAESYGGRRVVYLSKYLPADAPLYGMEDEKVLDFALPHIQRMFPKFRRDWVLGHSVYRADYAQPIVSAQYQSRIPAFDTPIEGLHLATMAQIYPEDRGTNYAIRQGREAAARLAGTVGRPRAAALTK